MVSVMPDDMIERGIRALGMIPDPQTLGRLAEHIGCLAAWNRKMNLTAITTTREMVVLHVLDSLSVGPLVRRPRVLDVGSGGGFPGIPLSIVHPDLEVVLVESRRKKAEFLRYVVARMKLRNVTVANSRIELYRNDEKFDTLIARAFASLPELVRLTGHLQKPGSRILAMKGRRPETEAAQLPRALRDRLEMVKLEVPYLNADRHAVVIDI